MYQNTRFVSSPVSLAFEPVRCVTGTSFTSCRRPLLAAPCFVYVARGIKYLRWGMRRATCVHAEESQEQDIRRSRQKWQYFPVGAGATRQLGQRLLSISATCRGRRRRVHVIGHVIARVSVHVDVRRGAGRGDFAGVDGGDDSAPAAGACTPSTRVHKGLQRSLLASVRENITMSIEPATSRSPSVRLHRSTETIVY